MSLRNNRLFLQKIQAALHPSHRFKNIFGFLAINSQQHPEEIIFQKVLNE